jgi:hypothetical protein
MTNAFEQIIGSVFAECLFRIGDNATVKVLTGKRQCEYGLCQRTNAMPMSFPDPTSVHQRGDAKSIEKGINLSVNLDAGLSLGSNAAMSHLGPFFLILLCFSQKRHYIKRLAFQLFSMLFQHVFRFS